MTLLKALHRLLTRPAPNPAFPASDEAIDRELVRMRANPKSLERPVLVLGGYRSPRPSPAGLARSLTALTSGRPVDFLAVSYPRASLVREALTTIHDALHARGWLQPDGTPIEMDVCAISMGGLVARAGAATPPIVGTPWPAGFRATPTRTFAPLRIKRLFTLATPHRGASLALHTTPDPAAEDMLPGSSFLAALDRALPSATFEMTCYTRLGDRWVGSWNTSPAGIGVIWTPPVWLGNHFVVQYCPRILADMARRLRGEKPLAQPAALPEWERKG